MIRLNDPLKQTHSCHANGCLRFLNGGIITWGNTEAVSHLICASHCDTQNFSGFPDHFLT